MQTQEVRENVRKIRKQIVDVRKKIEREAARLQNCADELADLQSEATSDTDGARILNMWRRVDMALEMGLATVYQQLKVYHSK